MVVVVLLRLCLLLVVPPAELNFEKLVCLGLKRKRESDKGIKGYIHLVCLRQFLFWALLRYLLGNIFICSRLLKQIQVHCVDLR